MPVLQRLLLTCLLSSVLASMTACSTPSRLVVASPPPELLEDCPPPAISREVLPAIAAGRADDAGRAYVDYVLTVEAAWNACRDRQRALRAYVRRMETLHDPS